MRRMSCPWSERPRERTRPVRVCDAGAADLRPSARWVTCYVAHAKGATSICQGASENGDRTRTLSHHVGCVHHARGLVHVAMRMCVCALQVSRCTCRVCRASCCGVVVGAAAMGGARGGDSGLVLTAALHTAARRRWRARVVDGLLRGHRDGVPASPGAVSARQACCPSQAWPWMALAGRGGESGVRTV